LKKVSLVLIILLLTLMVLGPLYILKEYIGKGNTEKVGHRLHWNTGNSTRISGADWVEQQRAVWEMIPLREDLQLLMLPADDWKNSLQLLSEVSYTENIFPYLVNENTLKNPRELKRQLGSITPLLNIKDILLPEKFKQYQLSIEQELNVPTKLVSHSQFTKNIIIVSDKDPSYAMPAATWSALTGDKILVINPTDTSQLAQLSSSPSVNIYLLGNKEFTSNVAGDLGIPSTHIITDNNASDLSGSFAKYYDRETGFGWWASQQTPEGGKNFFLVNNDNWQGAILAAVPALDGRFGPVLLTDALSLPASLENYFWQTKSEWFVTPTEGPYNHTFIFGSTEQISFPVQARLDFIEEINPYMMQGDQGVSALDGIVLVWLTLSVASAIWLWCHITTRKSNLSPYMKYGWTLLSLTLGPLAIYSYYLAYRGYTHQVSQTQYIRPFWVQAVAATLSTLAYGAPTMILTGFILSINGLPLVQLDNPLFIIGNPMVLSMVASYVAGYVVLAFLFVPLMLMTNEQSSYLDTVHDNLLVVFVSMTGISIGMLAGMWWLMMEYLPMMAEESNLLWWGVMSASTILGAFTGLIFNWPLVAHGRKKGDM